MRFYISLLAAVVGLTSSSPGQTQTQTQAQPPIQPQLAAEITINLAEGVPLEFVLIHPGTFLMGAPKGADKEKPVHKVTISKPYYLGKNLITQEQWQSVMGKNPSHFKGPKNPVERVSWKDCQAFAKKLHEKDPTHTFRLPTEAEWEYACRAGSTTEYCYGDAESQLEDYAWFIGNSDNQTHPVGLKKPNAWGLFDMHSNVWEWCQDWFGPYNSDDATDPVGPASGTGRIWRGGSWDGTASDCRSARRRNYDPNFWYMRCGVRMVMTTDS